MRVIAQKVAQAAVTSTIDGVTTTASIANGLCVLVGFEKGDTKAEMEAMAKQLLKLRIFSKEAEEKRQTNSKVTLEEAGKDVLLVSQFTLSAVLKGGRPSFHRALEADGAKELFDGLVQICRPQIEAGGGVVQCGIFGSWMQVHLVNEGPFTICLTSRDGKCEAW